MNALRDILAVIGELFAFLWTRKRWWLMPLIVVLLLAGILIVLGSTAGIGPLIYTLF